MLKSELVKQLNSNLHPIIEHPIVFYINEIIEQIILALLQGERIAIKKLGTFKSVYHGPRIGRNPKTGKSINIEGKYTARFKLSRSLAKRINYTSGFKSSSQSII